MLLPPLPRRSIKREIAEKKWAEARQWAGGRTSKKKYRMPKSQKPDGAVAGSSKRLASRFYQIKTGHCLTGQLVYISSGQHSAGKTDRASRPRYRAQQAGGHRTKLIWDGTWAYSNAVCMVYTAIIYITRLYAIIDQTQIATSPRSPPGAASPKHSQPAAPLRGCDWLTGHSSILSLPPSNTALK